MNSIELPLSSRSSAIDREHEKRRAEDMRQRRALVHAVRDADKFIDSNDVRWPAQAIDRLMADARDKNIRGDDIKRALANRQYKVGHWERLRMKSDARTPSLSLVKKVRPYVQLLEAIADALGVPPDDVIYEAFQNTKVARNLPASPNEPVADVAWLLEEMSRAVIKAANLADYFHQARTVCASYDAVSGDFIRSKYPLMTPDCHVAPGKHGGYLKEADLSWDQPPFPGVTLLRVKRAHFTGPLLVETRIIAPEKCSTQDAARIVSPTRLERPLPFGQFDVVQAKVTIFSDVRLVIGPRTRFDDLGLMFERHSFVQLETEGGQRPLTFPYSVVPISGQDEELAVVNDHFGAVAAKLDDGWHRVTGFGKEGWSGVKELAPYFGMSLDADFAFDGIVGQGEGYEFLFGWEPVNVQTIAQLIEASGTGEKLFETAGPYPEPTEIWLPRFPELQISLLSGALDTALVADCQRLKASLAIRINEAKEIRERETASVLSRWRGTP